MYLVDYLHQHGIAVILDWVPSHFPSDAHGLAYFDGTHLYEHADFAAGFPSRLEDAHLQLRTHEVAQLSDVSAMFWPTNTTSTGFAWMRSHPCFIWIIAKRRRMDSQQIRGTRKSGSHRLPPTLQSRSLQKNHPDIQTTAEESTSWPMVSRPVYLGGSALA